MFWYGEMENLGDGLWGVQVFLPSGAYPYNYEVTDERGNRVRGLDDPANPSLRHGVTGDRSYSSMVYVPYDKVQGKGEFLGRFYADRSVELPRRNRSGRVEFVTYESYFGPERGLAVYLPIDYREQSEDPYKVLYLSHGAVGEDYGGELRWMQEGDVPCILDNLIASGKVEPFLVVTMDNQYLGGEYWDFDYILREQERIMAYVEEHYHVSTKPEDRAYAGIGEGGIVASQMLLSRPDLFGYYGFWSECSSDVLEIKSVLSKNKDVHLMLGCGLWETADSILVLRDELKKRNLLEDMLIVPGACDWKTRQLLFAYAAEHFFWKAAGDGEQGKEDEKKEKEEGKEERKEEKKEEGKEERKEENKEECEKDAPELSVDYAAYPKGYTVFFDDSSPTGVSAVFVYEEEESYEGLQGEVSRVYFFSNTLSLFSFDSMQEGVSLDPRYAYSPQQYKIGMYPAGGDNTFNRQKINYYAPMTPFAKGLWGLKIPVFSGAFDYNFQVFDALGHESTGHNGFLYDPHNLPLCNASGVYDRSSMFYVPYLAETMGEGEWMDRSVCVPRKDGHVGKLIFKTYESENGIRDLGIYLPYGYNPEREKPYQVLYLSHGQQSERQGTEMRWLCECAAVNIMDNLEGDFLVVTMNNKSLDWEENRIWEEVLHILSYMEKHYHVGREAKERAFAGFSMGGFTTQRIYFAHPEAFGYFGIWSFGMSSLLEEMQEEEKKALLAAPCKVQLGAGDWDYMLEGPMGARTLYENLTKMGGAPDWAHVPAAHDWVCWQMLLSMAIKSFFWK